jgi:hypothetical protein
MALRQLIATQYPAVLCGHLAAQTRTLDLSEKTMKSLVIL